MMAGRARKLIEGGVRWGCFSGGVVAVRFGEINPSLPPLEKRRSKGFARRVLAQ